MVLSIHLRRFSIWGVLRCTERCIDLDSLVPTSLHWSYVAALPLFQCFAAQSRSAPRVTII